MGEEGSALVTQVVVVRAAAVVWVEALLVEAARAADTQVAVAMEGVAPATESTVAMGDREAAMEGGAVRVKVKVAASAVVGMARAE